MRSAPSPAISDKLLAWYDRHARDLPWRVGPAEIASGKRPDPYGVWLSEIMLQQTTVAAVKDYFAKFTAKWPDIAALAAASEDDILKAWAGLGYYSRARNLKKCADAVMTQHDGAVSGDGRRIARAARDRRLHVSGDRGDRLQRACGGGRRQCRARRLAAIRDRNAAAGGEEGYSRACADADARGPARRFRTGDDGSRRDAVHAEATGLPALPVARRLRRARCR
jgi:hypothetical protein